MDQIIPLLFLMLGALFLTALSIPLIKRLAWHLDIVDHPASDAHKSHQRPIPYGGGLAIYLGATLALSAAAGLSWPFPSGVLAEASPIILPPLFGATLLFAMGLLDDWRQLPPLPRFLIQLTVTAGLVVGWPEFRLALFAAPALPAALMAVLWIAVMTNAFNFLDNMDGLSAGIAAIVLALLGCMALLSGHLSCAILSLALVGAIVGFLFYNFPPASIFMGDAGGLFLGFLASSASILLSNHLIQAHPTPPLDFPRSCAPLLLLGVPLYDFVTVNLIRLYHRVPPWIGDNNHISHRLVRLGLSRRAAVLIIYAATLLTGLVGLLLVAFPNWNSWLLLTVPSFAFGVALFDLAKFRRQSES